MHHNWSYVHLTTRCTKCGVLFSQTIMDAPCEPAYEPGLTRSQTRKSLIEDEKAAEAAQRERLKRAASMQSLTELTETMQVPNELMPALAANRPELLRLIPKRPHSAEEASLLIEIIRILMETNEALRIHARQTAAMTDTMLGNFKGTQRLGQQIADFANFREPLGEDDEHN